MRQESKEYRKESNKLMWKIEDWYYLSKLENKSEHKKEYKLMHDANKDQHTY